MEPRTALTSDSSFKEICLRLAHLNTTVICDAVPTVRLMEASIKPIGTNTSCVGRAYTINSNQDILSTMQALDDLHAFLESLDQSQQDITPIILTIASCGSPFALAGGMSANVAKMKGFGGLIIDGLCRDVEEIKESGLPFFAKGQCAKAAAKNKVGTRKEQITCGGITVNPGDIIFADQEGIVAISKEEAILAITKGEEMQVKEQIALQKIQAGANFNEVSNIDEHIKNLQAGVTTKLQLIN